MNSESAEAVKDEICAYMSAKGTLTIPSLRLQNIGHKQGIDDAKILNDLSNSVREELTQRGAA